MSEKYEKQQQIELLNKQIMQRIVDEVGPKAFIDFYTNHNQKETMEKYGIRTTKQLRKILILFKYDFSKPKPSRYKGKPSARSHESYLAGGKKSSETQKNNWEMKPKEEKDAWSKKQKAAHSSEEFKAKIKRINIDYKASLPNDERQRLKELNHIANKKAWSVAKEDILAKQYKTKKKNKSFNSSAAEETFYKKLIELFTESSVIRQYSSDERYPFNCDFYIKSLDIFIELNFSWTHGYKPFEGTYEDLAKLARWQEKAITSTYYKNAIETWTVRDVIKFNIANKNKLNYLTYYSNDDLKNFEDDIRRFQ